ncbi:MAG: Ig-like domain-containing protein [Armatimonadota bacterium]
MQKSRYVLALLMLVLCGAILSFAIPASCEVNSPVVGIVMPPNGATISGSQVEITAGFASDADHPVSKLRVFLNGQTVTERIFESPSVRGNSSFRWDTTRTPNGRQQIDIQAFSSDGDYLGMATSVVMVLNKPIDTSAPKITIANPKEGEIVSGVKTISITASDDSGIDPMVSIFVDDAFRSVSNTKPYTYEWDTTKQENGPHIISVKATDEASNEGTSKPVKVIVRNAASPVVDAQSASSPVVSITIADASKVAPQSVSTATPVQTNTTKTSEPARVTPPQTNESSVAGLPSKAVVKPSTAVTAKAAVPVMASAVPAKTVKVTVASPKPTQVASAPKVDAVKTAPVPVKTQNVATAPSVAPKVVVQTTNLAKAEPVAQKSAVKTPPAPVQTQNTATAPSVAPKVVVKTTTMAKAEPISLKPAVIVKEPIVAKAAPVVKTTASIQQKPAQAVKPVVVVKVAKPVKTVKATKTNVVMVKAPVETEPISMPVKASVIGDQLYKVRAGESVSLIANVFGTSNKSIMALNNIEKPKTLKAGSKLILPANAKMVRMRTVVEQVGGTIEWNAKAKTARAICAQSEIKVKIGSKNATINDEKVKMDRKANIHDGRTIVPKSVMEETLSR